MERDRCDLRNWLVRVSAAARGRSAASNCQPSRSQRNRPPRRPVANVRDHGRPGRDAAGGVGAGYVVRADRDSRGHGRGGRQAVQQPGQKAGNGAVAGAGRADHIDGETGNQQFPIAARPRDVHRRSRPTGRQPRGRRRRLDVEPLVPQFEPDHGRAHRQQTVGQRGQVRTVHRPRAPAHDRFKAAPVEHVDHLFEAGQEDVDVRQRVGENRAARSARPAGDSGSGSAMSSDVVIPCPRTRASIAASSAPSSSNMRAMMGG